MNLFDRARSLWVQPREFRAVFAKLARHTDRELRDMGIDRSDLTRIAHLEAERRMMTPAAGPRPRHGRLRPRLGARPVSI